MMRKQSIGFIAALIIICLMVPAAAFALDDDGSEEPAKAKRTILMYVCGSNLETNFGMASHNFRQILDSEYSKRGEVNFIVMTGGANQWQLEQNKLVFPGADEDINLPEDAVIDDDYETIDPTSGISNCYNQIWEAKGEDSEDNHGKLVLLDGDGVTSDQPIKSEEELMSDPKTLKAFINYGVANYPAEKYDLILWDHGGGSTGGFAEDDHDINKTTMPFSGIVDAIRDNAVTNRGDSDTSNDGMFDFINFDACLMNCIDMDLVMADYTDYYIASPEIVPGYGQYYTGWLNTLGDNPETNTFALGKEIVDDFVNYYDEGDGKGQEGTMAVIDTRAFINSGITGALCNMSGLLRQQAEAETEGLFYDEINAAKAAINYESINFVDLGNFASFVSVTNSEVSEADLDSDGALSPDNAYTREKITQGICGVLQNPDIIYAKGTRGIQSKPQVYRTSGGELEGGILPTSGVSFYFVSVDNDNSIENYLRYYDEITKVIEMMPNKTDGRYDFLDDHRNNLIDYAFISVTGKAVDDLINDEKVDRTMINYDRVKEYLMEGETDPETETYTTWSQQMRPLFKRCANEELEAKTAWLDRTIRQQAAEAVDAQNVSARKVKQEEGTGYQIRISDTRNRIIDSVERKISLEIPAIKDYMEEHEELRDATLEFGSVSGSLDISSALNPNAGISDIIRWYNGKESEWILRAPEEKWYAIKDANGNLHAVAVAKEDDHSFTIAAASGAGEGEQHFMLKFEKGDQTNKLTEITDVTDMENSRPVKPEDLVKPIELMPALHVSGRSHGVVMQLYIPTSDTAFLLSKDNAGGISLVYEDIKKIEDIRDTSGDGTALHSSFSITDMYGNWIDISDAVNGSEEEVLDIALANVKPAIYNNRQQEPKVVYQGETLKDGTDYIWELVSSEGKDLSKAGDYVLLLTGKGRFTGTVLKTFTIKPAPLAVTVSGSSTKKTYSGKEQTYRGTVTAKSSTPGFDASKFKYKGSTVVKGTKAGVYTTKLTAGNCTYADTNYVVTWTIGNPVKLTIANASATKQKTSAKIALDAGIKATSKGNKVKAAWGSVEGADCYVIYAGYCDRKCSKLRTVGANTHQIDITKLGGKKLNTKKNLKYYVFACKVVNGKKIKLARSIMAHAPGSKNSKHTNVKAIKVKKASFTLKKGKKAKIKAKLVLEKKNRKPLKHEAKFRYASSNKKVAKVSRKGKITAVGKGKCTVYVYAVNGCAKKIKVIVK